MENRPRSCSSRCVCLLSLSDWTNVCDVVFAVVFSPFFPTFSQIIFFHFRGSLHLFFHGISRRRRTSTTEGGHEKTDTLNSCDNNTSSFLFLYWLLEPSLVRKFNAFALISTAKRNICRPIIIDWRHSREGWLIRRSASSAYSLPGGKKF